MSPEQRAKDFAVKKVGPSVSQDYWRSQLEEAWLAGHTDGVSFREWAGESEEDKKKKAKSFSDKNRSLRDQVDPNTGERVQLKTKKQIQSDLSFELDL